MKITFPAENVVLMGSPERERPAFESVPTAPAAGTAGIRRGDKLAIRATVMAEVWRSVELAAVPAASTALPVFVPAIHRAGFHYAEVELAQGKNTLIARDRVTGETVEQTVFYVPGLLMKYRFSLDDNS